MSATPNAPRNRTGDSLLALLGARSIVIVGMPGSGKSSIGRRLAPRLGLPFVDADAEIEQAAGGMTVAEIFAKHGEAEFRSLEARVIARLLLDRGPAVIATGGGAFMNADTRALTRTRGVSIWLRAEIPVLLKRVKRKSDRPLLQNPDPEGTLTRLLAERERNYAEADIVIASHEGPHETVVESIVEAVAQHLEAMEAERSDRAQARP